MRIAPHNPDPVIELRVAVNRGCGFRCVYCNPPGTDPEGVAGPVLSFAGITRFARLLRDVFGLAKIRLTGGEPLLRPGLATLVAELRRIGIPDIALTTNGQRLAEAAPILKAAGLSRVNVSLDSIDPATFRALTGAELGPTLTGVETAVRVGLTPVKLNAVVLRGYNDGQVLDLLDFAVEHGCSMRFLELMPIGPAATGLGSRFVSSAEVRHALSRRYTLSPLPHRPGCTCREYRFTRGDGTTGIVGFVSPVGEPFCSGCGRLRLTGDGRLIGCLGCEEAVPVAHLLPDESEAAREELARLVREALARKRTSGCIARREAPVTIGG